MKIPSMEDGFSLVMHALNAFVKEVEEFLEMIIDRVKEIFQ